MEKINFQSVIEVLEQVKTQADISENDEKINAAIEELEITKSKLSEEQDDTIDMVDEVQDYLEYLLNREEAVATDELKAEIADMINDLRQFSR